ncbi:unnamed protein product, partial [Owenia fusiformis]
GHGPPQPNAPAYPHGQPGYPPQGQPGYPPQGQPGYHPQGQPGYAPQGQPGYHPQGQPGYPPQGQPGYQPQGQPGYPPQGQPGYPPQGQPGYPPQGQPGYPPQGQPGYHPPGQPGYPPQGQPGYPPQGQPGHPHGGVPQPEPGKPVQFHGEVDNPTYMGSDIAGEDLPEDHSAPEPTAKPADPSQFGRISGYENTGYANASAPPLPPPNAPPSYDELFKEENRPREDFTSAGAIPTEDQAREALLQYVGQHCCYGKGAVNDLVFTNIKPSSGLHYVLETFTEMRSTAWTQAPYRGGHVDGPQFGVPPPAWSIASNFSNLFQTEVKTYEVPHTASIVQCHQCFSSGFIRCHRCYGRGSNRCISCHGTGHRTTHRDGHAHRATCFSCHGRGRKRCLTCRGHGMITCPTCQGYRQLKNFIELTVKYENHAEEYILEKTDMPDHLIKNVQGKTLFEQKLPRCWPMRTFPEPDINQCSNNLIMKHLDAYKMTNIIMQRQTLRAVPVSECAYTWKGDSKRYWVYGNEHQVYCPDYPQTCCWGCNIL